MKKRNFYDFLKSRNFQKLTTDFENHTKHQAKPKHASFWTLTTSPYPTKQVRSILPPILHTSGLNAKFLIFNNTVFMREKIFPEIVIKSLS